jgi:hypothetical protein
MSRAAVPVTGLRVTVCFLGVTSRVVSRGLSVVMCGSFVVKRSVAVV